MCGFLDVNVIKINIVVWYCGFIWFFVGVFYLVVGFRMRNEEGLVFWERISVVFGFFEVRGLVVSFCFFLCFFYGVSWVLVFIG